MTMQEWWLASVPVVAIASAATGSRALMALSVAYGASALAVFFAAVA